MIGIRVSVLISRSVVSQAGLGHTVFTLREAMIEDVAAQSAFRGEGAVAPGVGVGIPFVPSALVGLTLQLHGNFAKHPDIDIRIAAVPLIDLSATHIKGTIDRLIAELIERDHRIGHRVVNDTVLIAANGKFVVSGQTVGGIVCRTALRIGQRYTLVLRQRLGIIVWVSVVGLDEIRVAEIPEAVRVIPRCFVNEHQEYVEVAFGVFVAVRSLIFTQNRRHGVDGDRYRRSVWLHCRIGALGELYTVVNPAVRSIFRVLVFVVAQLGVARLRIDLDKGIVAALRQRIVLVAFLTCGHVGDNRPSAFGAVLIRITVRIKLCIVIDGQAELGVVQRFVHGFGPSVGA